MSKVTETRQQKGIYVRKTLGLAVLGAAMTLAAGNAAAADGSFTGEAQGMGPVSVGITVANGRVSAVQVNVANETPGYGRDIGATMEKRILEAQSADVDGVSGATITSTAVKAAAKSAFAKAGLVAAAAKSPVKAGTYVGSAQGAKSRVHATVKVDEKGRFTIEKITSGDTPYVSDSAFAFVEKNIEDGQTLAVDALTGATLSSRGLVGAVSDALRQAGVDVRLMTSATDLVRGANGIETVSVADDRSTYRIRAKAVVLATGYSGLDAESVKLFYPNLEGVIRTGGAGVTSFAPKWVLKEGGKVAMNPGSSTMLGYDSALGIDGAESEIYQKLFMPWVNLDGKRFMSEGGHGPSWGLKAGADMPEIENVPATGRSVAALMKQPEKRAWMIFDSTHEAVKHYEHLAGSGLAKRADTLEGLAEAAGIRDVKAFEETIAQYNADFEKGGDTLFAVPKNEMRPVLKAPFYAVRIAAVNTIANTTAYADDDTTILMGPNGPRVEGLFGAGGAIGNCITNTGLGAHNATALSSGAIAGAAARAYAEKH